MLKLYKNISYLFIALLALIFLGFYKIYFGLFPSFNGLPAMAHLHATAFLLWFALLIAQPILIKKKKYKIHRMLGKLSYFLVPLIIFTIIGMTRFEYYRHIKTESREDLLSDMLQSYLDLSFFVGYYIIAMINRKKLSLHVSYIIASSLVLLGPGLGRLIAELFHSFAVTVVVTFGSTYLILIALMIIEKRKFNRSIFKSPYLLILGLFIFEHILMFTVDTSVAWQWIADKIATHLF